MWCIVEKYDETLAVINKMAMVKMHMNAHKGAIEDCLPQDIIIMMKKEVKELENAILDEDLMHVIEEAADVMNFIVAITHQQITQYRERKK